MDTRPTTGQTTPGETETHESISQPRYDIDWVYIVEPVSYTLELSTILRLLRYFNGDSVHGHTTYYWADNSSWNRDKREYKSA